MWKIEIPRLQFLKRPDNTGIKAFFDVELQIPGGVGDETEPMKINGLRLVERNGKMFVGYPSSVGKDGKRYPTVVPNRRLTEAIQSHAEQAYKMERNNGQKVQG